MAQAPAVPSAPAPPPQAAPHPVAAALPVLTLTTDSGLEVASKDVYETGRYRLTDDSGRVLLDGALDIKGRGFSTWNYPKKPYRLKLGVSAEMLGMPANRHWVLLANYLDKTLLRNEIAFELSRRLNMEYTPRSVQVVVELNGTYRGIYQLTEHVRLARDRINIPELKVTDVDPVAITGGYLIEIDERKGEVYCPESARTSLTFCMVNPETLLEPGWEPHKAYIDAYLAATETALYSPQFADPLTGYAAYIDVPSAIDSYLINELTKNVDANFYSSVFMYKKRGGKLTFGPVWDFDLSIGNAGFFGVDLPMGWYVRNPRVQGSVMLATPWYTRMFEDPAFDARVRARWAELRASGVLDDVFTFIDQRAAHLSGVQARNFERWDILFTAIPLMRPVVGTYATQVADMKSWLRRRRDWMDSQLR